MKSAEATVAKPLPRPGTNEPTPAPTSHPLDVILQTPLSVYEKPDAELPTKDCACGDSCGAQYNAS